MAGKTRRGPASGVAPAAVVPDFEPDAWLSAIVDSTQDAVVGKTLDGIVVSWNPAAERLFGYSAAEMVGRPVAILADPDDPEEMDRFLARLRAGERIEGHESVRRRKDGTLVPVALTISPIRNATGELIGASKLARDISERRKADERVRLLNAELGHRTRNLLSLVLAIVRRSAADSVVEHKDAIVGRIMALDRSTALLRDNEWHRAKLEDVVGQALAPFRAGTGAIAVEGPEAWVDGETAQALAMAFHELATNAVKHGALSHRDGRLALGWERAGDGLEIRWCESGSSPVVPPTRVGMGTTMLRSGVEGQIGGTLDLDWGEDGLICTIAVPSERIVG